jgi:glycolate oxidase iron-sulfur subunit
MRSRIPARQRRGWLPNRKHARTMLTLAGCAQAAATPNTHAAAARVFDRLGITLVAAPGAGCCGALSYHLGDHAHGKALMRRNIDAWWPAIDRGSEAIVVTASGCGATIKEYGSILRDDPVYADKAETIASMTRDAVEVLAGENLSELPLTPPTGGVAVHCPCTLSHGQKLDGHVEAMLATLGFELSRIEDGHLCCGSAGTYSILQPSLSRQLRDNKIAALTLDSPQQIVTANVGCQLHLGQATPLQVSHWIELLDRALLAD